MTAQYSIGDFAKLTGLSTYTLRYYEKEKLITPARDNHERRFYTEHDIKWVGFLLHLKGTGMSMNEIKQYVKLRAQGDETIPARRELLNQVQARCVAQIEEMKMNLHVLSKKIDWYDGKLDHSITSSFDDYLNKE